MVSCLSHRPSFQRDIPHKGIDTNASNCVEKIFQNPCESRTSQLYRGFCVDFEELNAELGLWRFDVFDEKVDSKEFESVSQWLWSS